MLLLTLFSNCSYKSVSTKNQLQTGSWTKIESVDKSIPTKRHEAAFVGIGDDFYLLGGRGMKPTSHYNRKSNS